MSRYDTLAGPELDAERWVTLEIDLGGGDSWRCEEPSAKVAVHDGVVEMRTERFERSHDQVQILDNPKYLLLSAEQFSVPNDKPLALSVEMSAEPIGCDGRDYRDGFAAFNVLDMSSGMVWDHISTGVRPKAICERLFIPGLVDPSDAFTWVVDAPLAIKDHEPGDYHRYELVLNRAGGEVSWLIDGNTTFQVFAADIPSAVSIGFGLITLHPLTGDGSVSLRGQGMVGRWRNFDVAD